MSYQLDWIVENRIILLRNEGTLTGDDIERLSRDYQTMISNSVAPVHIIEDDRELENIEDVSLDVLRQMFEASTEDWSKLGWAVAIVPDELEAVADIFGRITDFLTDLNYERVETLPEALNFLDEHDATLPERDKWELI